MSSSPIRPPQALKIPHRHTAHGLSWDDDYAWLRDHGWPKVRDKKVLDYLHAENAYTKAMLAPYKNLETDLFNELKGRIKLADVSVPVHIDDYFYYTRTETDKNYSIHCRKYKSLEAPEAIILDENELAKNHTYFRLGDVDISDDHAFMVYAIDTSGAERFHAYVKRLDDQTIIDDHVRDAMGDLVWHKNGHGFFYAKANKEWRSDKIYFHRVGTPQDQDQLIYHEKNPIYSLSIEKSSDLNFVFIANNSKTDREIYAIDMRRDGFSLRTFIPRRADHLYDVDHRHGFFYISTNDKGKNFRLVRIPADGDIQLDKAEEIWAHSPHEYLTDYAVYRDHVVLTISENGLSRIVVVRDDGSRKMIPMDESVYTVSLDFTTFEDSIIRLHYASPITPQSVLAYDDATGQISTLKIREIPSGYDKNLYHTERLWATSSDGVKVPVTLMYRKDIQKDGSHPVYLYGYGSYGYGMEPGFSTSIFSLVDRGYIYALAHIRGGDDLGFEWYEQAKFLTKKKTFEDFIAIANHLINEKFTRPGNIIISGGSAGGMLVGACANMRPDLWRAVIAHVPFVDVLNTMLDDTLPLTPGEFLEWGNPKDKAYFDYIRSYSPYDNIKPVNYPSMFVTAGISDPRVTYWEPAKWVAKLRATKTDRRLILFDINMDSGHGGASGRFERLKDIAKEYTYILSGLCDQEETRDK